MLCVSLPVKQKPKEVILLWLLAEVETDRKSDVERKSSADPDTLRRQQPVSINTSITSSSSASTAVTTDANAAALAGIFDDFDWDLDSAESLQGLSEEDLKKRRSVMIEKVSMRV